MTRLLIVACLLLTPPLVMLSDAMLGGMHARPDPSLSMGVVAPAASPQEAALPQVLRPN